MEDRQLSGQESLDLIARMLSVTRARVERGSGRPFLIWGYTTVAVSAAVWLAVTRTADPRWFWLWLALPAVALPLTLLTAKSTSVGASTYFDRIIGYVWWVCGTAGFFVSLLSSFFRLPVLFLIILIMGMGTALTGLIIRFPTCSVTGFVSMALSLLCLIFRGIDGILVFAAVFVVMMIIPGHILQHKCAAPTR